jgi:tetratricopeptide (TPR) repeat protein
LLTIAPGYQLLVDPDSVDALRFERLANTGRTALRAGEPPVARERLTAALGLWRGDALAEFDELPALVSEGRRLDRLRLSVLEDRIEAGLAMGLADRVVGEVEELVREHPTRERLWGQLMTALYRVGRQTEALEAFRSARTVLIDEFGVEPSPELAGIHQQILGHDPGLAGTVPDDRAAVRLRAPLIPAQPLVPAQPFIPAQLPFGIPRFAGRTDELARLDDLLAAGLNSAGPSGLAIPVVSGTAGVGKTALAVHWAHRVMSHFPDGQLYADLRGFDRSGVAADPADIIRRFLDALGAPLERIPSDLPAQTGLFRSLLAGKRILLLLDNARDADQVRPLLPGPGGCLAIVTSRDRFTPLIAIEGAEPVALDVLSADQARELMIGRLGPGRVADESPAVDEIVSRCAGLPLALAVATARAVVRPDFPLAVLAAEMSRTADGLDVFHGGDPGTDVRSVFSWSYRTLSGGAARLFQLLGIHPGPDVSLNAAAGLCGLSVSLTWQLLAELLHACLITEHLPGRFTFHDLLRAYAADMAGNDLGETDLREARERVLDLYLHTAGTAAGRLEPQISNAQAIVGEPLDYDGALVWFAAEHRVLLAAIADAAGHGFDGHAWQLARACTSFLHRQNHWRDLATTQNIALGAALRSADRRGQAYALYGLGLADRGLGRLAGARIRMLSALDLFEQEGDRQGEARVHQNLAWIADAQARHDEALHHGLRALALYETDAQEGKQATALSNVGWYYAQIGEHDLALDCCRRALDRQQHVGDRYGQAHTWDSLGYIHRLRGDFGEAIGCYEQALRLFRETGDRYSEAIGLAYLGDVYSSASADEKARRAWRQALDQLDRLGHPDASRVRGKLTSSPVRAVAIAR